MKQFRSLLIISVVTTAVAAFSLGWSFSKQTNGQSGLGTSTVAGSGIMSKEPIQIKNIDEVWAKLQENYYEVSKLDLQKLTLTAAKGFVAGIGDPYTLYMTPEESKDFQKGLEGELEGIGAELEAKEGKLIIVTPLKNSPAARAGLKAGDIIDKIDGEAAAEMTMLEAIKKIRGKKGTSVTLVIIRENLAKPLELTIVRDEIVIENVVTEALADGIFHVTINQFNDHTKKDFETAIQQILLARAKGIVLDVRGNGGGYLDTSIDVLSELISGEKIVVVIKKRDVAKNESIKTKGGARLGDIPLVVLVNKGSASASEILAGGVQDLKRGIIIGEKTFGKGSVQELIKLNDGSLLRATVAKWFTPSDRSIDDVGIEPDIAVKLTEEDEKAKKDPQLDAAIEYLKKQK